MILVDDRGMAVKGTPVELLAEVAMISRKFIENHIATEEDIMEAVRIGCADDAELEKECKEAVHKFIDDMFNDMKEGK